jgi:hypothetical protein
VHFSVDAGGSVPHIALVGSDAAPEDPMQTADIFQLILADFDAGRDPFAVKVPKVARVDLLAGYRAAIAAEHEAARELTGKVWGFGRGR